MSIERVLTISCFLLGICFSTSSFGANPVEIVKAWVRSSPHAQVFGVGSLLTDRCAVYFTDVKKPLTPIPQIENECRESSVQLLQKLDIKVFKISDSSSSSNGKSEFGTLVFHHDLWQLIHSQKILIYLQSLLTEINLTTAKPLDFWGFTQKFSGSRHESLRWIGTLFQDISEDRVALRWLNIVLEKAGLDENSVAVKNYLLLSEIIDKIQILTKQKTTIPHLFYPTEVSDSHLLSNAKLYHFYVIAHLSNEMKKSQIHLDKIVFTSFLFNYLYEIFHDHTFRTVFGEPAGILQTDAADLWAAYQGSFFALQLKSRPKAEIFFKHQPSDFLFELAKELTALPEIKVLTP